MCLLLNPLSPLGTLELAAPGQAFVLASKHSPSVSHCLRLCVMIAQAQVANPGCTSQSPGAQGKHAQARLHPQPVKSKSLGTRPRPSIKKQNNKPAHWVIPVGMYRIHRRTSLGIQEWFPGLSDSAAGQALPGGVTDVETEGSSTKRMAAVRRTC